MTNLKYLRTLFRGLFIEDGKAQTLNALVDNIVSPTPWITLLDFDGIGDGVHDDSEALSDAAINGNTIAVAYPHRLTESATVDSAILFQPGGKLIPDSGVTITINGPITIADTQYAFDVSQGGSFAFGIGALCSITPQHFGARGDGSTDDTAAVQACLTIVSRQVGVEMKVTGAHKITRMLTMDRARGARISGLGAAPTLGSTGPQLVWSGADNAQVAMLEMINCRDCHISGLLLWETQTNPPTKATIYQLQDDALIAAGASSGGCRFEMLNIICASPTPVGIWIDYEGTSFNDQAFHTYTHVQINGGAECGWRIGRRGRSAANAKGILFDNCIYEAAAYNILGATAVECWIADFQWRGGFVVDTTAEAFRIGGQSDPILITGCHFERCDRLLRVANNLDEETGSQMPVTVRSCNWDSQSLNNDSYAIMAQFCGPLILQDNNFGSDGQDETKVFFCVTVASQAGQIIATGNKLGYYGSDVATWIDTTADDRIWAFGNVGHTAGGVKALLPSQLPLIAADIPFVLPFAPTQLPGLELDLDANSGVSGAGATLVWLDSSRRGNTATAAGTATGLVYTPQDANANYNASIAFNGTDDYLTLPASAAALFAGNTPFYLIVVKRLLSMPNTNGDYICASNTVNGLYEFRKVASSSGSQMQMIRRNDAATLDTPLAATAGTTTCRIEEWIYDGTNLTIMLDGVQDYAGALSGGAVTITQVVVGAQKIGAGAAGLFTNMALSRILGWSTVPGSTQRATIRTYYKLVYGIV